MRRYFIAGLFFGLLSGCVTAPPTQVSVPPVTPPPPPTTPATASVRLEPQAYPAFTDDFDTASLLEGVRQSAAYYRGLNPDQAFRLAQDTYTAAHLAGSMEYLAQVLESTKTPEDWLAVLRRDFAVYQSVGTDKKRNVTFSSYYEPTIHARLKRDDTFRYPLYGRPRDLIDVDLGQFDAQWAGHKIAGRREKNMLVPYHTRETIDSHKRLAGQGYEIAWTADPMDIFFLQIEGSGWLDLGGGETMRIRYDGNNGRKYRSVGLHLINSGRMTKEGFSHANFHAYMSAHPEERQALLNHNERFIFFRLDPTPASTRAYGNIGVPLTPGRSMATDPRLFGKGLLGWIKTQQTQFDAQGQPTGTKPLTRFMVNQDEGGAILGPGRVDFFAGAGPEAERFATHFWFPGELYFLVKKK